MSTFSDPADHLDDDPAPLCVLYVEDHPVNVLLMQALFAKRPGLRLIVATTGEEGLRAARLAPPALLLLDLRLPDCHGTQLLRRLRELPGLREVPAVAVTAEDTIGVAQAGFAEVWHKPMNLQAALGRLDRLLHRPPPPAEESLRDWTGAAGRGKPPRPIPFPTEAPQGMDLAAHDCASAA
ncbi:MAG TPA: response regulator [Albitalea sp.]|nr:response regulator [Albitalea sp.]